MLEQLTRESDSAKNSAKQVAGPKRATAPEFLLVPRKWLRHSGLNWTDTIVWAAIDWREELRRKCIEDGEEDPGPVSDAGIGRWLDLHRTTILRSRERLAETYGPYPDVDGALKVLLADVRKHGVLVAMAMAQLRGWPERKDRLFRGQSFLVPARKLAEQLGVCTKTACALLRRLVGGFVQRTWGNGAAAWIRLLGEREKPLADPRAAAPRPTPDALAKPVPDRDTDKSSRWMAKLAELDATHGPAPA